MHFVQMLIAVREVQDYSDNHYIINKLYQS